MLCRGKLDAPLAVIRHIMHRLDLALNETKTHIVDAKQESFNFLGFEIRMSKGLKSGKEYPYVSPAPKSLAKVKARIKQLTARKLTPIPLEEIVGNINATLRGWSSYYYYRNCKPHVRFDEEGLVRLTMEWLLRHRQTKEAETDRRFLMVIGSQSFTLLLT